jgi:hypothetical protein
MFAKKKQLVAIISEFLFDTNTKRQQSQSRNMNTRKNKKIPHCQNRQQVVFSLQTCSSEPH